MLRLCANDGGLFSVDLRAIRVSDVLMTAISEFGFSEEGLLVAGHATSY